MQGLEPLAEILAHALRLSVQAHRCNRQRVLGEDACATAVHRDAAAEHEAIDARSTCGAKHVERSVDVDRDRGVGVVLAFHLQQGCEMDNPVDGMLRHDLADAGGIADVARRIGNGTDSGPFIGGGRIAGHDHDIRALGRKIGNDLGPDQARAPGHQYRHCLPPATIAAALAPVSIAPARETGLGHISGRKQGDKAMALDLILRNARVSGDGADGPLKDIGVRDGVIVAVEPDLSADGESVDAAGRLVSPGLIESHFHLDKARIVDRCAPPSDRRTTDHMARTAAIKHTFTVEDIYARARATLEQCILNGVTHMRTQVEVDPNVGMKGFEAIRQLAEDYRWGIDLQLCVFLQEGWTGVAGAEENLLAALRQGAPAVGGAPRYDTDPDAQIRRIFAVAREFDVDIDIHLDGGHTTHDMKIYRVCDLTDEMGWGGRVAIGHGAKYSCLPPEDLKSLGMRLAKSSVAVSVLPATDLFNNGRHQDHSVIRGVADGNALIACGANCAISSNNVLNPFTPFGDCSLIRIANMYANVVQRGTTEELGVCFEMVTERPARILGLRDYGIAVGAAADLVIWNAASPAEAVATIAQPLCGFKRGKRTFTRKLPELHRP